MPCSGFETSASGTGVSKNLKVAFGQAVQASVNANNLLCGAVGGGNCPEGQTCGYLPQSGSVDSIQGTEGPDGDVVFTVTVTTSGKCECQEP